MPEWRWLHTPGHAPGHISLWREADRALIVGDAFITTAQESAYAVATQQPELHGPPMYFTPNWIAARSSVETLAALQPGIVITGHGPAMEGRRCVTHCVNWLSISMRSPCRNMAAMLREDIADESFDAENATLALSE